MLKLYNEHVLPDSIRNDKLAARQLYTVSLLYSVMLQRRKYGACGWSSSFDLDITDWITSTQYMTSLTCDSSLLAINSAIIKVTDDQFEERALSFALHLPSLNLAPFAPCAPPVQCDSALRAHPRATCGLARRICATYRDSFC